MNKALEQINLPGPGRTPLQEPAASNMDSAGWQLQVALLQYRLENPCAFVPHPGRLTGYGPWFIRAVLHHLDQWTGSLEHFCALSEVPYPTLEAWKKKDEGQPYKATPVKPIPSFDANLNDLGRMIVEDYSKWQGSLKDFFVHERKRVNLPSNQIRRVLVITGMIGKGKHKNPRYRGSTKKLQPGTMLVTDGKEVNVHLTSSEEVQCSWDVNPRRCSMTTSPSTKTGNCRKPLSRKRP
ncbi:MAG: hypothetical protein R6V54_08825 [Desulfobacteraceae bacterium]